MSKLFDDIIDSFASQGNKLAQVVKFDREITQINKDILNDYICEIANGHMDEVKEQKILDYLSQLRCEAENFKREWWENENS